MGHTASVKVIRGQLRQISKELLPEVLANTLAEAHYANLQKYIAGKLSVIESQVTETLKKIDERSVEMQNFVMRQVVAQGPKAPSINVDDLTQEEKAMADESGGKKVKLDPSKVKYDGKAFTVVLTEEELKKKFNDLQRKISEDQGDEANSDEFVEKTKAIAE